MSFFRPRNILKTIIQLFNLPTQWFLCINILSEKAHLKQFIDWFSCVNLCNLKKKKKKTEKKTEKMPLHLNNMGKMRCRAARGVFDISSWKLVWKKRYKIVRNRRKPYKTVEKRSNSDIFRRICMVNLYGFLRFRTVSYNFVQFPTFTFLTEKICYIHKKFTRTNP